MNIRCYHWFAIAAVLALVLTLFCRWQAIVRFGQGLEAQLESSLPAKLTYKPEAWDGRERSWASTVDRINADLAGLKPASMGPLSTCSARVLRVMEEQVSLSSPGERLITLQWLRGDDTEQVDIGLACRSNWPYLLATQIALAGIVTGVAACLPRPPSIRRRGYIDQLQRWGCARRTAWRLTRTVDELPPQSLRVLDLLLSVPPEAGALEPGEMFDWIESTDVGNLEVGQMPWLARALELYPGDMERALAVARSEPLAVFRPGSAQVVVHGIELSLPITPFLYYYWYATRRLNDSGEGGGGWFTNPPSHRSDRENSGELLQLMVDNGGHGKAINDLREKGLRAKTLDQNRSKVKEQLTAVLGEELAAGYLFELERDPRTARFRCRLATDPALIVVESRVKDPCREVDG